MILNISEEFSEDVFNKFVESINILGEENLTIYLSSRGGDYFYSQAMLNIINSNEFVNRITLIGYNLLASSAFELFFLAKCKKELIGGTIGMYHQSSVAIEHDEFGQPVDDEDRVKDDFLKIYCRTQTEMVCKFLKMNDDLINNIRQKRDVWFTFIEMQTFLLNTQSGNNQNHFTYRGY